MALQRLGLDLADRDVLVAKSLAQLSALTTVRLTTEGSTPRTMSAWLFSGCDAGLPKERPRTAASAKKEDFTGRLPVRAGTQSAHSPSSSGLWCPWSQKNPETAGQVPPRAAGDPRIQNGPGIHWSLLLGEAGLAWPLVAPQIAGLVSL